MEIPKIIDGIDTDKNANEQRRNIIRQTYMDLLQRLQQTKGKKAIFNDFWGVDVLFYEFENEECDYLNFTVKLTLGIKNDGRHIQYSINKVDILKNKNIL